MNQKKIFRGSSLIGFFLILLGVFWVLNNLDIIDLQLAEWWPLVIIVLGIIHLVNGRSLFNAGAWILIAIGVIFLLNTNDILEWEEIWRYWPVLLIFMGISIIARRQGFTTHRTSTEDEIDGSALFSGIKKKINSKNFRGGSVSTLFGGAEIDLRDCTLDEKGALIDISTLFGGTEIRVPESWPLDIRSSAIFGGIDNKTSNEIKKDARGLVIKASVIFGGIEIKN
jgi:predicted membrane protein